jgi:multidrug efflux pump subunit AcrA (membrane-fusion protein)
MRFLLSVTAVTFAALAAGCDRPTALAPTQSAQSAPAAAPAVKVVRPEKKAVRRPILRPGFNIEPYERTPIYAKVAGYVRKWNVDIGDGVRKDDVLAEIDVPEMEVELKQKEASVLQAASEIKQAQSAVLRAEAEERRAKSQFDRMSLVGRGGVLDKDQVDEYRLGFEAAQAAVAKAQADVDVARARHKVAEADCDRVRTLLQYTTIKAPYDGVVTHRAVSKGDFVQPAAAGKGEALFVVEQLKPARVYINVPDIEAAWVRDGDAAVVRVPGLQGRQFRGTVTRSAKSLNPVNRTLRTEIDLPNDDGRLLPGMFVDATIIAERKDVWALPAAAVVTQGDQTFCYRVEDGKAIRTSVQVGLRGPDLVEVVKKQTKPARPGEDVAWEDFTGEEIVAGEASSFADGQAVTPAAGGK